MLQPVFQQIDSISRIGYMMEKVISHRLPQAGMIHNIMRVYMDKMYSKHIDTKFYAFDGIINCKKTTFLVSTQYRSFFSDITITTSVPPDPKLITFEVIKSFESLLDWNSRLAFKTTFQPEVVREWCKKHGQVSYRESCIQYYMDINDSMNLDSNPKPGYRLGLLYSRDGNQLSKIWPYFMHPGTAAYMIDCIETFGGIGIYKGDRLVCSILNSTNGRIFALHVDEAHRGKGIAEWALVLMTILIASRNIYPNALVLQSDMASQRVFEKVGFKKEAQTLSEIRYTPKD